MALLVAINSYLAPSRRLNFYIAQHRQHEQHQPMPFYSRPPLSRVAELRPSPSNWRLSRLAVIPLVCSHRRLCRRFSSPHARWRIKLWPIEARREPGEIHSETASDPTMVILAEVCGRSNSDPPQLARRECVEDATRPRPLPPGRSSGETSIEPPGR